MGKNGVHIVAQRAAYGDDRLVVALCHAGNAHRGFAKGRLSVYAALAGNNNVGVAHMRIQPHGLGHNFAAGAQPPLQECKHRRAHAASSASAGHVCHIHAKIAAGHERKILQIAVELLHHLGRGPLLRAKYGGCPARAAQGVVHIAGNVNDALAKAGVKTRHVYAGKPAQPAASAFDLLPLIVQQPHAQSLKHGQTVTPQGCIIAHDHHAVEKGVHRRAHIAQAGQSGGVITRRPHAVKFRQQVIQRSSQGFFRISVPCPVCRGEGKVITHPCAKCRGQGVTQINKNLKVRIPGGVDNGSRLRLRGEGEPGDFGGPHGDLYVVIYVEDDKIFTRRGQDLVIVAEISIVQAILGAKIEVPTLEEPVTLEIPKGTQSGKILRIKGLGLPHLGSTQKGDLLVEVSVRIPTNVTKKQEELLREFEKLEDNRPLNKVKDFFKKAMGD